MDTIVGAALRRPPAFPYGEGGAERRMRSLHITLRASVPTEMCIAVGAAMRRPPSKTTRLPRRPDGFLAMTYHGTHRNNVIARPARPWQSGSQLYTSVGAALRRPPAFPIGGRCPEGAEEVVLLAKTDARHGVPPLRLLFSHLSPSRGRGKGDFDQKRGCCTFASATTPFSLASSFQPAVISSQTAHPAWPGRSGW